MLSTSPFEFIVRHFFWLLFAVMIIGVVNGLFFFPILLSLIGPEAELIPLEHPERISTPSPPTYRHKRSSSNTSSSHKNVMHSSRQFSHLELSNASGAAPSQSRSCNKPHHHHKQQHVNMNNEPSLTTITEEPQSWKSSSSSMSVGPMPDNGNHLSEVKSIVVQPEVTVETTQTGIDQNTTKVTATANIKVELVTPGRISRSYHNVSSSS